MRRRNLVELILLGVVLAFPWLPGARGVLGSVNQAATYTVVAASLVLLTGWVGQISLAQAALVGIGAYSTGWAATTLHLPFPVNLPVAALAGAAVATLLGVVALRVRGLYLAVATLIFSWAASEFFFRQPWVLSHGSSPARVIGGESSILPFDFSGSRIAFYYAAWGTAIAVLYALSNLRDSRTGRAFFAVRGSEMAAASLGINVLRYKALAFALSGALAAVAGNLVITHARVVSPDAFTLQQSMFFLAVAVVGGLTSLGGAVAAAMLFASLTELFFRVPALSDYLQLVSTGLLAFTFRVYPGGIARLASTVGARLAPVMTRAGRGIVGAAERVRRNGAVAPPLQFDETDRPAGDDALPADDSPAPAAIVTAPPLPPNRQDRRPLVEADHVTVQFGGLTAVNGASLTVREGEIVGLIGPNGAGKTTLFNSIAGFNTPTSGTVRLYGVDATAMSIHRRAALGVARTFQLIQLFPQLTVFENLLAATHLQNRTGFVRHIAVTSSALRAEREARQRVQRVVDLLDLGAVAHRPVAGLPFGVLRMVEVARSLVTGARLIMLDEPASGLDNRETDRLTEVLRFVRDLGATLLLIEHDVRMVTSVSDYMYVLERGSIIAEGEPAEIQSNEAVIAAYLGGSAGGTGETDAASVKHGADGSAETPEPAGVR